MREYANSERSPEFGAAWLAAEMQCWPEIDTGLAADRIDDLAVALTEQRNPRSENLEKMSAADLVKLFIEEEKFVMKTARLSQQILAARLSSSPNQCAKAADYFMWVRNERPFGRSRRQ